MGEAHCFIGSPQKEQVFLYFMVYVVERFRAPEYLIFVVWKLVRKTNVIAEKKM